MHNMLIFKMCCCTKNKKELIKNKINNIDEQQIDLLPSNNKKFATAAAVPELLTLDAKVSIGFFYFKFFILLFGGKGG